MSTRKLTIGSFKMEPTLADFVWWLEEVGMVWDDYMMETIGDFERYWYEDYEKLPQYPPNSVPMDW